MGQILIIIRVIMAVIGASIILLGKFGLRGLPGDIFLQKGNMTFFFPVISCIALSVILTIVVNLFFRR